MQGQYTLERTIKFPDMVARIYRPVLTEEQKSKRIQAIKKATADLLKGVKN